MILSRWKRLLLREGGCVYMARALLADPFLPRKIAENRENEIVSRTYTQLKEDSEAFSLYP